MNRIKNRLITGISIGLSAPLLGILIEALFTVLAKVRAVIVMLCK